MVSNEVQSSTRGFGAELVYFGTTATYDPSIASHRHDGHAIQQPHLVKRDPGEALKELLEGQDNIIQTIQNHRVLGRSAIYNRTQIIIFIIILAQVDPFRQRSIIRHMRS